MNKEQFIKYVNDFSSLSTESLKEIKLLIDEFPHFQTAWVLYAKNLHKIQDVRFENKLKIAATHIGDRKVLKSIIDETNKPVQETSKIENSVITPVLENPIIEKTKHEVQEVITEEKPETTVEKETIQEKLDDTPEYKKFENDFVENEQNTNQNETKEEETSVADLILKNIADINNSKSKKDVDVVQEKENSKDIEQVAEQKEITAPESENRFDDQEEYKTEDIVPEQIIETSSEVVIDINPKEEIPEEKVEEIPESVSIPEESTNNTASTSYEHISQNDVSDETEINEDIQTDNEVKILTKPGSSAADRILKNIDDIKTGSVSEKQTEQDLSNKSELEQIIAQRLKELGIQQEKKSEITEEKETNIDPEKDVVSEITDTDSELPEEEIESINTEQNSDILDINQFTSSKKEAKSEKEYSKPDLKSDDYLNFEFDNEAKNEKSEKKIILNSDKKNALIDKFLSSDPRIVPQKDYASNGSFATDSVLSEDEELFSETLAKIYIKQEHYDKAILTYEKLCLKYPEKNIYFVSQIEKIKELIKK